MTVTIVVYAGFVVFGVVMALIYVNFTDGARQLVEVVRNITLVAAGAISLPALLYALWIREASYGLERERLARAKGESDIVVQD